MKKLYEVLRVATRIISILILCLSIGIVIMKDIRVSVAQVLLVLSMVAVLGLYITKK